MLLGNLGDKVNELVMVFYMTFLGDTWVIYHMSPICDNIFFTLLKHLLYVSHSLSVKKRYLSNLKPLNKGLFLMHHNIKSDLNLILPPQ